MRASGAIVCSGVIDGTSIVSANVFFALQSAANYNNGQTPADSAFTYDDFPPLNAGNYVWQATKITDSDGKTSLTGKMCLGQTTDFLSGTEVYAVSTSNSEAPADNDATHTYWDTSYTKENGKYLWTATRVQYTNGSYAYLNKKCVGYWGEDGNGIQSVTRTYARSKNSTSTNDTTAPSDIDTSIGTSGWAATSPSVNETYPYLWVKEVVTYTKSAATTKYYCNGARGANGVDAQDIEWVYIRTKTNVAPVISGDGGSSPYTDHNGKTYTSDDHLPKVAAGSGGSLDDIEDGNSGNTSKKYECTDDPKGVDSTWKYEWEIKREKGAADANGHRAWQAYSGTMTLHNRYVKSITSANVWYALADSGTNAPADSVFGNAQTGFDKFSDIPLNPGKYVWEATKVTYSDGTSEFTAKMCLGQTTDFLSGTEVYAVSTSNSEAPADNDATHTYWDTSYTKENGKYLWTATRVQYTNGSYEYLNKKCVGYWGEDGTSPWFADLDNEMDSVICGSDKKPVAAQTIRTAVALYHGITAESFTVGVKRNGTEITVGSPSNGVTVTFDGTTNVLSVSYAVSAVIDGKDEYDIMLTNGAAGITRKVRLTVNGIKGDARYSLVPSVAVVSKSGDTYSPASVECSYTKLDVAKGAFVTPPSGGTVKYTKDGGSTEYPYNGALIPGTDFTSDVTFLLYVGTDIVDNERVPIVKDGAAGAGQPSYIWTQEAWSSVESVADETTEPKPNGGWSDVTPSNSINNYAYLWRRSKKMVLQSNGTYSAATGSDGQWKYVRLSGTNGTSIKTKGSAVVVVETGSTLPSKSNDAIGLVENVSTPYKRVNGSWVAQTSSSDGESYVISESCTFHNVNVLGHLIMWSQEAGKWIDIGQFKGDAGTTYYTHVAWATRVDNVITQAPFPTPPAGQTSIPNVANLSDVTGGDISPSDSKIWMGVLVNTSSTQDDTNWHYYTWSKVQGVQGIQGNDGTSPWIADIDNENDSVFADDSGKILTAQSIMTTASLYHGDGSSSEQFTITKVKRNNSDEFTSSPTTLNNVTVSWTSGVITIAYGVNAVVANKRDTFEITLTSTAVNTIIRTCKMTVLATTGDKYSLVVSPNAMSYNENDTWTNKDVNIKASSLSLDGTVTENIAMNAVGSDMNAVGSDMKLAAYYKPSSGGSAAWTDVTGGTPTGRTLQVTSDIVVNNTNILIELRKKSGETYLLTDPTTYTVEDYETIPINKVKNGRDGSGSNAVKIDLDNEADYIPCDSGGVVMSDTTLATKVRIYDGSSPKTGFYLEEIGSVTVTRNGSQTTIAPAVKDSNGQTVTRSQGIWNIEGSYAEVSWPLLKDDVVTVSKYALGITAGCMTGSGPDFYYATFVAGVMKSGSPGVNPEIWQLAPTHDALSFGRNADDTLTPSSIIMKMDVKKTVGTVTEKYTSAQTGIRIYWGYDDGPQQDYRDVGATWQFNASAIAAHTYVWFELRSSADSYTDWIDRETIPITRDGLGGLAPSPNILLRTTFQSFAKITEKWTGSAFSPVNRFSASYTGPTPTDEMINGHNIVRMDQATVGEFDMYQDVGLEAGRWYALSFFHRQGTYEYGGASCAGKIQIFMSYGDGVTEGCIEEHWLDGVKQPNVSDGYTEITGGGWAVTRHVIRFRTVSDMTGVNPGRIYFRFKGGINVISMPKLEAGEVATPYIANDDDLKGENGRNASYDILSYGRSMSNTDYSSRCIDTGYGTGGWGSTAPQPKTEYPYVWEKIEHYDSSGIPQGTSYVCLTGQKGKMSRNFWYAGLMRDLQGKKFSADDYQAPYVNVGDNDNPICYQYVGSNGTDISYPNKVGDYNLVSGWEMMTTDFKYLIAKAVFSGYANLGSAVFNDDFMFSQYLNNEQQMFSGSFIHPDNATYDPDQDETDPAQGGTGALYNHYHLVGNQTSIPVTAGTTYTIRIGYKANNDSIGVFARVYYNDKEDWSGTTRAGSIGVMTTDTNLAEQDIVFVAEHSGYAKVYAYGYGTIYEIRSLVSAGYEQVSPMFINTDPVPILYNSIGTESTAFTSIVEVPVHIIGGRKYRLTMNGYVTNSLYDGHVGVYYDGELRHEWVFNNEQETSKAYTFTAMSTGYAYLKFRVTNSQATVYVSRIYIQCTDAFVPTAAVNWLTGYAHFAGDRVRFNPDGSGHMAGGNLSWDALGNIRMTGNDDALSMITENDNMSTVVQAGHIEIRSKTTQSYGIFEINGLGEVILSMYDKDGNCVINLGGSQTTLVNGEWITWKLRKCDGYDPEYNDHMTDGKSYFAANESQCTPYYQLRLGQVVNQNSGILYFLPPAWDRSSGEQTIETDGIIPLDNMLFTGKSITRPKEVMVNEILNLNPITDGFYIKPNNGRFYVDANINGPVNYWVDVYHFENGRLSSTIKQRFSL